MSSLTRRIVRRRLRAHPDYERPAQEFIMNADGSMEILHPTKGWRHVSAKRRLYG